MHLFYCPDITPNSYCTLDAEESRHAVRVLRLREGDEINVTDGKGHLYRCRIIQLESGKCIVESGKQSCRTMTSFNFPLSTFHFHLAVAPTKNPSRMEWLVEKAVEMGVGEITLLQCDHSERTFLKTERLEKLAISAMKQSLHLNLPRINPAISLRQWLAVGDGLPVAHQRLIAHCEADKPRTLLHEVMFPGRDTVVLIGPEGDFSHEEITLALEHGFQPVSFGSARLRTETAALYAVAAFNFINEQ